MALDTTSPTDFVLWADLFGPMIRLHDREADADLIAELWASGYTDLLAAVVEGVEAKTAVSGFQQVLAGLPRPVPEALLDDLAADYADAYLNHGFRAAPTGSVWMTEDHLERQQPMFDVREWYAHYGLSVPDWRLRSDDHLVHELQFVVHLLQLGTEDALTDAAAFLDAHVLPWVPDFCKVVAARARQPFLAGVGLVTRAMLDGLREDLAQATGREREIVLHLWAQQESRAARQEKADEERPFVPGAAESW